MTIFDVYIIMYVGACRPMYVDLRREKVSKFVSGVKKRTLIFVISDVVSILAAMTAAMLITFDFGMDPDFSGAVRLAVFRYMPVNLVVTVAVFMAFKLYISVWSFASITELAEVVGACFVSTAFMVVSNVGVDALVGRNVFLVSRVGYYVLYFFILTLLAMCSRFGYRLLRLMKSYRAKSEGPKVMIIGGGDAGAMLIGELNSSDKLTQKAVCIIDDNEGKTGKYIKGVPIVGTRKDIPEMVKKYSVSEIMLAIPSAPKQEISAILDICAQTKCSLKVLPGVYQLVTGEVIAGKLRDVEISDLLGREQIRPDIEKIIGYINGKTVLVTGGGGSIGSELCRQIASHSPKRLIIVDIYENNAYDIQQELRRKHPDLDLTVLIASVRNTKRIDRIFETYRPEIVYHAAAHKHVPLMEVSPNEAIKNNVFGTLKTVQAADKYGVERFVLISTDKAVNPTNVMGATKRICEMIVQTYNNRSKTEFVAVRFGNVLGSNGSVIPLFKKQIAEGGPVLVTHPEIIRYFMTIPEAVSLVLSAGAYAKGGEIFVLDMGKPVKILDLATNLIRLSGYTPNVDIKIEFTGLRPGEKLYEELLMDEEGLQETENKLIHIGKPIQLDEEEFLSKLSELYRSVVNEPRNVRKLISEIVPTYKGNPNEKNI